MAAGYNLAVDLLSMSHVRGHAGRDPKVTFPRTHTCITLMYDISPTTCEQSSQYMAGGMGMKATCQQAAGRKCKMCTGTIRAACTQCAEHVRQATSPIKRTLRITFLAVLRLVCVHKPTAKTSPIQHRKESDELPERNLHCAIRQDMAGTTGVKATSQRAARRQCKCAQAQSRQHAQRAAHVGRATR